MRHGMMWTAAVVSAAVGLVGVAACDLIGLGGSGGYGGSAGADPFVDPDPTDLAIASMVAARMAYDIQGMLEENVPDPDTIDDATLVSMAEQYAPEAAAAAEEWAYGLDAATVAQWVPDWKKQGECHKTMGCEFTETCTFTGGPTTCFLASCGAGKCGGCPDTWNLSSLIVKGWCGYVCLRDGDAKVVGYAASIRWRKESRPPWLYCYEAANQN